MVYFINEIEIIFSVFPYVIETLLEFGRTRNCVETLALRARVPKTSRCTRVSNTENVFYFLKVGLMRFYTIKTFQSKVGKL